MSKLIYIDTKDITCILDTTAYEKRLIPTLSDPVVKTVKIPDDEIVREISVIFKSGKTITFTGNEAISNLEILLGFSILENGEVIEL